MSKQDTVFQQKIVKFVQRERISLLLLAIVPVTVKKITRAIIDTDLAIFVSKKD